MLSTRICENFIYAKLANDSVLQTLVDARIWAYEVTGDMPIPGQPYILYANLSTFDVLGVGPAILMARALYVVRGVVESDSFDQLDPIAERIHALLHGASGPNHVGEVYACVRERAFTMTDTFSGRPYRHLGGVYRFWTQ